MTVYGDDGNQDVQNQAVLFEVRNANVMKVTYSVRCCTGTGRNFLFAGAASPLTPCESPPPMTPLLLPPPSPPPPSPLLLPPLPPSRLPSPAVRLATNVACLPYRDDEIFLDLSGARTAAFLEGIPQR